MGLTRYIVSRSRYWAYSVDKYE